MPQVDLENLSWEELRQKAKSENLTYVHLDPHNQKSAGVMTSEIKQKYHLQKAHPVYWRYTTILDLSKSEDQLLESMKPKTRYNLRLAQKKGVSIRFSTEDVDLAIFNKLFFETVNRQSYFGRSPEYYKQIWNTLKPLGKVQLAIAEWNDQPLVAWMLFMDNDILYYPYGGSSSEHRELMAAYLLVWEIVKWGKEHNFKYFDLWGTLGPNPDEQSSEFGIHRFKTGFGGEQIEYEDAYDMVIKPVHYKFFKLGNALRWWWLKLSKK